MTTDLRNMDTGSQPSSLTATVKKVLAAKVKDLGGFTVKRVLPSREQAQVGPWMFFDEMGPANFTAGNGINVRPHPHINLATVTYLFNGEMLHRDSLGSSQRLQTGDLNLMVAGRGIVHSERQPPHILQHAHQLHGLQLWLALPEADEECAPEFLHYPAASLPKITLDGVTIRIMIGEAYNARSPVKQFFSTLYLEMHIQKRHQLQLPFAAERAIYLVYGLVKIDDITVEPQQLVVIQPNSEVTLSAQQDSLVIMIGGESTSPRYLDWNFVSSRQSRIEQAKADWLAGRFDNIPGDDQEFIPLPSD